MSFSAVQTPSSALDKSTLNRVHKRVQPKLQVNEPGDVYEQEADAMANRVMRMNVAGSNSMEKPVTGLIGRSVQRKCAHCGEEEKKKVMRKESGAGGTSVSSDFSSSLQSKAGGSSLPDRTKSSMENAFGSDFSGVKIHTGAEAATMSNSINARAFTYGNDIYFNEGQYNPDSSAGTHLLAHELTHVIQQMSSSQKQVHRFTTQDCSHADYKIIDSADSQASAIMSKTIRILIKFIADSRAGNKNPVLEGVFAQYFGIINVSDAEKILNAYKRIYNTLAQDNYQYECEDDCDNENAYVYSYFSDIHLCMSKLINNGSVKIARVIIHEMSHYVTNTDDLAYCKQNNQCPNSLHYPYTLNNADSYACFAHDVYKNL